MQIDNSRVSKHLGKISEYKTQYDPSLLVREPRNSNRVYLNIDDDNPPFYGYDTWNAYEVSSLTNKGMPVVAIAKIIYSCRNKYIVESKSLKLYLNSFNMTILGDTPVDVYEALHKTISKDLSELLETPVRVGLFKTLHSASIPISNFEEFEYGNNNKFITLEEEYPVGDLIFDRYNEAPDILETLPAATNSVHYHSSLLRSSCRVTGQPDFGDIFISMYGNNTVDPLSLLKYIVSFRNEHHFHEEAAEMVYTRLWEKVKPSKLSVKCLYTRRGGIDICPERVSHDSLLHYSLSSPEFLHYKTLRQ